MFSEGIRWRYLFLLLAATFVAAACGGGGGGGQGGGGGGGDLSGVEVNIGTLLPLTGDLAAVGPSMENGAKLAVQQINDCGKLRVNASYEDDGTNEQTAATAADKLINTDNVGAIIGAAASRVSFAVVDSAAQNSVVQISPSSTSPDFTDYEDNDYFFRTVPSDALQGEILAQVAQREGYETVNVLALNDDYGQGIANTFESSFGGQVNANVAYDPAGTSFNSEVGRVSQGGPDAILLVAFPETGTSIVRSMAEQGLLENTDILFTDGLATEEFPQAIDVNLSGARGTRPVAEGPGIDAYTSSYRNRYDEDPGIFSANTYDAAMLATLAAAAAGSGEGSDIQANLRDVSRGGKRVLPADICEGLTMAANGEDINYEGAAGSQNFDENGDVTSNYELLEIQDKGLSQVDVLKPSG